MDFGGADERRELSSLARGPALMAGNVSAFRLSGCASSNQGGTADESICPLIGWMLFVCQEMVRGYMKTQTLFTASDSEGHIS